MTTQNIERPVEWSAYGVRALIALIATPIAGIITYLIADALSAIPDTVLIEPVSEPITIVPVVLASLMGALGGIIVYAALLRFTRQPRRIFVIVAIAVLILAGVSTLVIGAPLEMIIALNLMHIVVAGVIITVLTRQ